MNGFSSHADQPILIDWIRHATPERLFLVHGEEKSLHGYAEKIQAEIGIEPQIALLNQTVDV